MTQPASRVQLVLRCSYGARYSLMQVPERRQAARRLPIERRVGCVAGVHLRVRVRVTKVREGEG